MRNLKLILQYIGTGYCGWQIQPNGPTVQETLQDILSKTLHEKITLTAAGRTDSGVHALGQVANFKTEHEMGASTLLRALNAQLPEDIAVLNLMEVPENFHALRGAAAKTYTYLILHSVHKKPFLTPLTWRQYEDLDLDSIQDCLDHLIGKHDFRAFCASDSSAATTVREILHAGLQRIPIRELGNSMRGIFGLTDFIPPLGEEDTFHPEDPEDYLLAISFKGRGFLKHMVRNLIGTLRDVGTGKLSVDGFQAIMESQDRRQAGVTAPAKGLFMVKVEY